ncbi:TssN family type VI secretion system protein [Chryseobacterium sp. MMS23-Vi53]|uniref:TssN family type VI secretion system protein n=1 Tax=Chryseobacterium sp. MMS23-Vi53 TaxID=3386644 RepID=UPI0039EC8DC6
MNIKKYFINLLDPKLLVMIFIVLALCVILTMLFSQKVPDFKQKFKGKYYTYVFSFAFVYAVIALLGYNKLFSDENMYEFIFYQISSLVLGIIHCCLYRSVLQKFNSKKTGTEYLFALVAVCFALIPFSLIYTFLNGSDFVYLMLGHFIIFFIPTFLNDTFNRAMLIPPKIYKTWQFPENYIELANLEDEEMRDLVVFSFLMDKDKEATKYSTYRAKGPTRIDFGKLFYTFVVDYNEKHSENPIETEDENGLYNWVFFLQPKWYESTKYIDPELTLYMNGIEENSVIFCMRTKDVMNEKKELKTDFEYTQKKQTEENAN